MSLTSEITWVDTLHDVSWPEDAVIVADEALPAMILESLPSAILVQAGERLKTWRSLEEVASQILERHASKPMTIVAVGGGSVGDALGFLASVLWRGVNLWHVPTTLLAMVDSAHGGKTALNLGDAKNQLGTFYAAGRVVLCRRILRTLPKRQRDEGMSELIKALWLDDVEAFGLLSSYLAEQDFETLEVLLQRAIEVKQRVVAQDPKETQGIRTFLNLGHTVAHALELVCGLSHGQAVAWGLACALRVSKQKEGLPEEHHERMRRHIWPMLEAIPGWPSIMGEERFCAILRKDKKRINHTLRSVLLQREGVPVVTTSVTAKEWFETLLSVEQEWRTNTLRLSYNEGEPQHLLLSSSKSEINRALVIKALRPGETTLLSAMSLADDVFWMNQITSARIETNEDICVYCGLGGTTLRFALAFLSAFEHTSYILAQHKLLTRPHEQLVLLLRELGAEITPVTVRDLRKNEEIQDTLRNFEEMWKNEEIQDYDDRIRGWRIKGVHLEEKRSLTVRVDTSSQFATAIALLSAQGANISLTLRTDENHFDPAHMASSTYFDLTLDLLTQAGVQIQRDGDTFHFTPTNALYDPVSISTHPDESSAAVWRAAANLGVPITLKNIPTTSNHGDRKILRFFEDVTNTPENQTCHLDLSTSSDLGPVLTVWAALQPRAVLFYNARHMRYKESDRIQDVVTACKAVGVHVEAREDGIFIPEGIQHAQPHTTWPTFEDHRMAMAGALWAISSPVMIQEPQVVTKSYPEFWTHARWLGFSLLP